MVVGMLEWIYFGSLEHPPEDSLLLREGPEDTQFTQAIGSALVRGMPPPLSSPVALSEGQGSQGRDGRMAALVNSHRLMGVAPAAKQVNVK